MARNKGPATGDSEHPSYEVGYRKPPMHSRFALGQSGNPKGRAPGAKSTKTIARSAFSKKITLKEGERQRTLTKAEALIETTINRGLQKGGKDADAAFKLLATAESDTGASVAFADIDPNESEILAAFEARLEARLRRKLLEETQTQSPAPTPESNTENET